MYDEIYSLNLVPFQMNRWAVSVSDPFRVSRLSNDVDTYDKVQILEREGRTRWETETSAWSIRRLAFGPQRIRTPNDKNLAVGKDESMYLLASALAFQNLDRNAHFSIQYQRCLLIAKYCHL
jgi:hypothetical protein